MRCAAPLRQFSYPEQSWSTPRRVVAEVEWHPGDLYPPVGFIVTKLTWSAEPFVDLHNQRAQ